MFFENTKGEYRMIELYLFLHPLDYKNVTIIEDVMDCLEKQSKLYKFHLVPTINFQTINHFMSSLPKEYRTIHIRNHALQACYDIALDFEALLTIDRQSAITYFEEITLTMKKNAYSQQLRNELLQSLDISLQKFNHRRQMNRLHQRIQHNQQLMHQMHVKKTPSCVLYNFTCDDDIALLLDTPHDFKRLPQLLKNNQLSHTIANYI